MMATELIVFLDDWCENCPKLELCTEVTNYYNDYQVVHIGSDHYCKHKKFWKIEELNNTNHKAVEILDKFTKTFCRDKNANLFADLAFRCKECAFEIENGECLVKIFKNKFYPEYKDFGSMGDL